MIKKTSLLFLLMILLSSCHQNKVVTLENDWSKIQEKAKHKTVNFYGWGKDPQVNKFFDTYLSKVLKDKYDIKINRIDMLPTQYLDIMSIEKQANKESSIDVVWINGNNFSQAKSQGLLMKDIDKYLVNYNKYIDKNNTLLHTDFNEPTDGYEVPFGQAQLVMIKNNKKASNVKDNQSLYEYLKTNKYRFTYSDPTLDFNGSAFVRSVILNEISLEKFPQLNSNLSDEQLLKAIKPGFDYLNKIKPLLWRNGTTYPSSSSTLDNMYSTNEIDFTFSYSPYHAASKVKNKEFSSASKTFILNNQSVANTHYLSIANNSNNKEAALVFINEALSIEAQLNKYNPYGWGDFYVFDKTKISKQDKVKLDKIQIPSSVLDYDKYTKTKVNELDASLTARIDALWQKHVLN